MREELWMLPTVAGLFAALVVLAVANRLTEAQVGMAWRVVAWVFAASIAAAASLDCAKLRGDITDEERMGSIVSVTLMRLCIAAAGIAVYLRCPKPKAAQ